MQRIMRRIMRCIGRWLHQNIYERAPLQILKSLHAHSKIEDDLTKKMKTTSPKKLMAFEAEN